MTATTYQQLADSASRDKEQWTTDSDAATSLPHDAHQVLRCLERSFGTAFSVIDCSSGRTIQASTTALAVDMYRRLGVCEQVARLGRPEIIEEASPLALLVMPLPVSSAGGEMVAAAVFVTEPVTDAAQLAAAAREFEIDPNLALRWAQMQPLWPSHAILELSTALAEKAAMQQSNVQLKRQLADVSSHLLMTFEEITLLHRLTERLSIAKSVTDLCSLSVKWLADVIPARSVAIWFESASDLHDPHTQEYAPGQALLIAHGDCPVRHDEFRTFMQRLGPRVSSEPLVLNRGATNSPTWFYPDVHEIISVPIREAGTRQKDKSEGGSRHFGWLLAINHTGTGDITNSEAEFGTVEACLMASVATILGIHCGNIALYHEQSEFFSSVVRALTSAIDAKDPYTCGHSDRVARLSVRIARQLGCDKDQLNTIYLSGLLHDIGKIGISDSVLRKPGALTPEEFDHIKQHPDLGCRILDGVKQLDKVLPIVRHHHEAWNGSGYPANLKEDETPFLARIVAVADSIDAMSSDRPYRKGMDDEKLDSILREGAGKQWDPRIVEAAFQVRDDLRKIGQEERKPLSLDVDRWHTEPAADETAPLPV